MSVVVARNAASGASAWRLSSRCRASHIMTTALEDVLPTCDTRMLEGDEMFVRSTTASCQLQLDTKRFFNNGELKITCG
jgi:hypothetical protein